MAQAAKESVAASVTKNGHVMRHPVNRTARLRRPVRRQHQLRRRPGASKRPALVARFEGGNPVLAVWAVSERKTDRALGCRAALIGCEVAPSAQVQLTRQPNKFGTHAMACIKQCRLAFAQRRCRTRRAMVDVRPAMLDALRYAGRAQRLRREGACASIVLLSCLHSFETTEQYFITILDARTQTKRRSAFCVPWFSPCPPE